jgi:hypothetical protein
MTALSLVNLHRINSEILLVIAVLTRFALDSNKDYYVHNNIFDAKNWTKAN